MSQSVHIFKAYSTSPDKAIEVGATTHDLAAYAAALQLKVPMARVVLRYLKTIARDR